jgi:hypothetical protein
MWQKLIGIMDIGMVGNGIIITITALTINITIISNTINADGCLVIGNMAIGIPHEKYVGNDITIKIFHLSALGHYSSRKVMMLESGEGCIPSRHNLRGSHYAEK